MMFKPFFLIIFIIALFFIGCVPKDKVSDEIKKKEVSEKYKFMSCEISLMSKSLNNGEIVINENKFQVLADNIAGSKIILHNNVFIDPFLKGQERVTVGNWGSSDEFFIPKEMNLSGRKVLLIKTPQGDYNLIFAGPDADIDNKNAAEIYSLPPENERLSLVSINDPKVIEYDPTNGLKSNGDILYFINVTEQDGRRKYSFYTNDQIIRRTKMTKTW